jgi:hypothetical protein
MTRKKTSLNSHKTLKKLKKENFQKTIIKLSKTTTKIYIKPARKLKTSFVQQKYKNYCRHSYDKRRDTLIGSAVKYYFFLK